MPVPGLSLVGFLDRDEARAHLRGNCVLAGNSDAALDAEWAAAKAKLGAPIPNAGNPSIQPIPPQGQAYITALSQLPWVAPLLASWPGMAFKMVEINPLLAFQHQIFEARSNHHCGHLSQPPTLQELLEVCLPQVQSTDRISLTQSAEKSSILLRAESLNIQMIQAGAIHPGIIGLQFGASVPLVHVVRFNGRCYLHNGFHRALGVSRAGASHIPCVFRDVATHGEAGVRDDGGTFSQALLESADPPTLAHFTQGRALSVALRKATRYMHVSWAEYAIADE